SGETPKPQKTHAHRIATSSGPADRGGVLRRRRGAGRAHLAREEEQAWRVLRQRLRRRRSGEVSNCGADAARRVLSLRHAHRVATVASRQMTPQVIVAWESRPTFISKKARPRRPSHS